MRKAMERTEGAGNFVIETWDGNPDAVDMLEGLGWRGVLDYHRMWIGGVVPDAQRRVGRRRGVCLLGLMLGRDRRRWTWGT